MKNESELRKFFVYQGDADIAYPVEDYAIVNALNGKDAEDIYIRKILIKQKGFLEHVYYGTLSNFLEDEKGSFFIEDEFRDSNITEEYIEQKIKENIIKYYEGHTDYSELFIDYYFNYFCKDKIASYDELPEYKFPEEMLVFVCKKFSYYVGVDVIPIEELEI